MSNDLHDFQTDNPPLNELNEQFLVDVRRFEALPVPISKEDLSDVQDLMINATGVLMKAEDILDLDTDETKVVNATLMQLSMQKIFSRLLRVANATLNPTLLKKNPQKEFDKYLKSKIKDAKFERQVRDNMRKLIHK